MEQGLGRLALEPALARAARGFADYMARTDHYGHTADGTQPADRASERGYDYCLVSENIAYQYSSEPLATAELARRYVEGWKDSPGHRKNMLEPAATDMAVAVARSSRTGRFYAVQMFGRPRSQAIEFRVTNAARRSIDYRVAGKGFTLRAGQGRIHTVCAPEDVSFPGAENAEGRVIRPSGGDNLVVAGGARLTIRQER